MKDKNGNNEWTVFGAGNLLGDIFDAIEENGQIVTEIVLNTKIEKSILEREAKNIKITKIGDFKPNKNRKYIFGFISPEKEELVKKIKNQGVILTNLAHPFSSISKKAEVGEGNFFGAGTVIGANAKIGNYNFFNRSSSVGHDAEIGNLNHIGPGTIVCGRCKIKDKVFLGAGAVVKDAVTITSEVNVGAGAVVTRDIKEEGTYVGVPAKRIK